MANSLSLLHCIIIFLLKLHWVLNFPPARLMDEGLNILDTKFKINLDKISDTFSHEEILKRGLIKSVTKYFYEKRSGEPMNQVTLTKAISGEYLNVRQLFFDYKQKWYCELSFEVVMLEKLYPAVASVDLDKATRKMPYAHFDAETFEGSNKRIIDLTKEIVDAIEAGDYDQALTKTGQAINSRFLFTLKLG